jgi:hypothetical protein
MRKLLVGAGLLGLLALFAAVPVGFAGHPVPYACNPVGGGGSICRSSEVIAAGPDDTGIVCGSGADAFDIFDQSAHTETRTEWYDENWNLTFRQDHDVYSFGQWATMTFYGENIYRPPTGAPVLLEVGQQVFKFADFDVFLGSHGPNELIGALVGLDPHGLDGICAALGAS